MSLKNNIYMWYFLNR